jgi:glycosyltransferase involved in cell wall biosynthesis
VTITVVTPTIHGREDLLVECKASVERLNLPHLVALDEHREGPAVVRNRLVEQVTTEWVLFLDDDDLLLPHYVRTVGRHLADADVVYTNWYLTGADAPQPYPHFDPELLRRLNFIPVTACVRTEAFRAVGGFPDVPLEDHGLWLALLAAGGRFKHVPVTCWRYRRLPGSRNEQAVPFAEDHLRRVLEECGFRDIVVDRQSVPADVRAVAMKRP